MIRFYSFTDISKNRHICRKRCLSLGNSKLYYTISEAKENYLKFRYGKLEDPIPDLGPIKYGYYNGKKEVIKENISEGERNAAKRLKFCPSSIVCLPKIILNDIAIFDFRGVDLCEFANHLITFSDTEKVQLWLKIVHRVMWVHKHYGLAHTDIKLENILIDLATK